MQKFTVLFFLALVFGFAISASAEPGINLPSQPEGCVKVMVDYEKLGNEIMPMVCSGAPSWTDKYKPRNNGRIARDICWFKVDPTIEYENLKAMVLASDDFLMADLWEGNALVITRPDLPKNNPIWALGSTRFGGDGKALFPTWHEMWNVHGVACEWFRTEPAVVRGARMRNIKIPDQLIVVIRRK